MTKPGILSNKSSRQLITRHRQQEPCTTRMAKARTPRSPCNMDCRVSYVPPQIDSPSVASIRALRQDPLRLFFQDAGVLIRMLPYLPWIFLPFKTKDDQAELYLAGQNIPELLLQVFLFLYESFLLLLFLPALIVLPGSVFLILAGISFIFILLFTWPLEGPALALSMMDHTTQASAERHMDEKWIFINGTASSHSSLQSNVDRIARIFGRAVVGIHNKTYGLPADLIECLIQRVFGYYTRDVRIAYEQIQTLLRDPTVDKVVLIGHSQ